MNVTFVPDDRHRGIAEAYALDAIDLARTHFGIALDRTERSIIKVDEILCKLRDGRPKGADADTKIDAFAKMFGSYIGEVFRSVHGGEWGLISVDGGEARPGIKAPQGYFWPWDRAAKRLLGGSGENVWHYYLHVAEQQQETPAHLAPVAQVQPARQTGPKGRKPGILQILFKR